MSRRYVLTYMELCGKRPLVCAVCEEHQLLEVQIIQEDAPTQRLNNMYVGRVSQVVKNIGAAFVEIQKGCTCFLPLSDLANPTETVYVKRLSEKQPLVQGDELLVQVVRDAVKTKDPQITTNLSLAGLYCVVTSGKRQLGISKKLDAETRSRLRETAAAVYDDQFGLVIRTNAAEAPEELLREEICALQDQMRTLLCHAPHRSLYAKLYEAEPEYIRLLQNQKMDTLEQVITDDAAIFAQLQSYAKTHPALRLEDRLYFYDDAQLDLHKLYALETQLERAMQKKVWLKSGANLVIEPTEALTVIDVNSAKNVKKKQPAEQHLQVNLEAAREIARQLRLRNLSGIIIIDFIDMKTPEDEKRLLEEMRALVRFDSVKTDVVGMTQLGLMELTRKKTRRPLHEQLLL